MNAPAVSPCTSHEVELCRNLHVALNAAVFDRREDEVLLQEREMVFGRTRPLF